MNHRRRGLTGRGGPRPERQQGLRLARRHRRGRGLALHARAPRERHRACGRPTLRRTVRGWRLARSHRRRSRVPAHRCSQTLRAGPCSRGPDPGACDVGEWEDVVALAAGSYHTVGITEAGWVLAAGDNSRRQCDVGDWQDIVAVAAGSTHTLGLRRDGTVVSTGNNAELAERRARPPLSLARSSRATGPPDAGPPSGRCPARSRPPAGRAAACAGLRRAARTACARTPCTPPADSWSRRLPG